ncbi:hypothetical protein HDV00_011781 [Rhizophlyctis rosea]|nr:hypothetical protein HDV00_011781 [Rhizophlyctis rosea]
MIEQYYPVDTSKQPTVKTLVEWAKEEHIKVLIDAPRLESQLRETLKKYMKLKVAPNQFRIEYCYSKHAFIECGRLYCRDGVGLQAFPRWVRSFIAGEYYIDVDGVCAQPSILRETLYIIWQDEEKHPRGLKLLDEYVDNRMDFMAKYGLTKENVNVTIMNGANKPTNSILGSIWNAVYVHSLQHLKDSKESPFFSALWKHIQTKKHPDIKKDRNGSFLALCLQTRENHLLLAHLDYCNANGYKCESLQFDGFLVRKDPIRVIDQNFLDACAVFGNERTEQDYKLAIKEFEDYRPKLEELQIGSAVVADPMDVEVPSDRFVYEARRPTHMKVARILKLRLPTTVIHDGSSFWMYEKHWRRVEDYKIRQLISEHVNPYVCQLSQIGDPGEWVKLIDFIENDHNINGTISVLRSLTYQAQFGRDFDQDPMQLGCENGFFDLRDGSFHPYSENIRISKSVRYDYFDDVNVIFDPSMYEAWIDCISKIFPIKDERDIWQTFWGYALHGDHPEKIFVFLTDKRGGDDGKSKAMQAAFEAMGDYATPGQNKHIYKSTGFSNAAGHNADVFAYEGFRLVYFEELDDAKELDSKKFKDQHGGNSIGYGRRVGIQEGEYVKHCAKWVGNFNHKCQPKWDTSNNAFMERLLLILCRAKFFKSQQDLDLFLEKHKKEEDRQYRPYCYLADRDLDNKIKLWRPYILKWMLEGHQMYLTNGFRNIPQSWKDCKIEVEKDVENLEDWVEEKLEKTDDKTKFVNLKDIKIRMPSEMKKNFKGNTHLITALQKYLGTEDFHADTQRDQRHKNVWFGWQFKEDLIVVDYC